MSAKKQNKIRVNKSKLIMRLAIVALIVLAIYFAVRGVREGNLDYEIATVSEYKYFVLIEDDKYGIIDKEGKYVLEAKYSDLIIPNPEKEIFICYEGAESKVLNEKGEEVLTKFEKVEAIRLKNITTDLMYEKSVLKYKEDGKWGLINYEGGIVAKAEFDEITTLEYKEGEMLVTKDGKVGVININGKIVVELEYDAIQTDNYFTLEEGQKKAGYIVSITTDEGYRKGYIDNRGDIQLETQYTAISRIIELGSEKEAYLMVAEDGQYGLYKNKTQLAGFEYKSLRYDIANKILIVEKAKKIGAIGIDGKELVEAKYEQIDVNGLYMYARDSENDVTVYNLKGEVQENQSEDIYIIDVDGKDEQIKIDSTAGLVYSIIDKNGNDMTEEEYKYINYLYDDNYMVTVSGGKIGIITKNEELKVEIKYDSLVRLQANNVIIVISTDEEIATVYNKQLEEVLVMDSKNFQYVEEDNYVKLYNDTDTKYVTKEGKEIENTSLFDYAAYPLKNEDGTWSLVDKSGNKIVETTYDKILELNEYGFMSVREDDKWGAIDVNGNIIVEPIYTVAGYKEPSFIGKFYKVEYGFGEVYYTNRIID